MDLAQDFETLFTVSSLVSLLTLSVLEIVLGIDNLIFISIVAGKLPKQQQPKARKIGLMLALLMRVALLFSISWIIGLKEPLFHIFGAGITGRALILFGGGLFLLVKTTKEIHHKIEGAQDDVINVKAVTLKAIIMQIVLVDIVFSFDSILTAVGLVDNVLVMILAVIISMLIMLASAAKVSDFINKHPTIKMLALAFLLMIGMMLVMESTHGTLHHIDAHKLKPYMYFSMAFSFLVELLNMRMRKKEMKRNRGTLYDEQKLE